MLTERRSKSLQATSRPHTAANFISISQESTLFRPLSAAPRSIPFNPYAYRMSCTTAFGKLHQQISKTFASSGDQKDAVLALMQGLQPKHEQQMIQLCKKYSIGVNRLSKHMGGAIDANFIASTYVRRRSSDRQKEEKRKMLRSQISIVSNRHKQPRYEQFFELNRENLLKMEAEQPLKSRDRHPYVEQYQKYQNEAMEAFSTRGSLQLEFDPVGSNEPEEWEKDSRHIKQIYSQLSRVRAKQRHSKKSKQSNQEGSSFYVT